MSLSKHNLKICIDLYENKEISKIIYDGLRKFNVSKIGEYEKKPFLIYAKDNTENIIGGIEGEIFDKVCAVHMAWVEENERKKGVGTQLFYQLEELAKQNACQFIQLDTTEFQARQFYEKLGFIVIASLPNNFKGNATHIMRKMLT